MTGTVHGIVLAAALAVGLLLTRSVSVAALYLALSLIGTWSAWRRAWPVSICVLGPSNAGKTTLCQVLQNPTLWPWHAQSELPHPNNVWPAPNPNNGMPNTFRWRCKGAASGVLSAVLTESLELPHLGFKPMTPEEMAAHAARREAAVASADGFVLVLDGNTQPREERARRTSSNDLHDVRQVLAHSHICSHLCAHRRCTPVFTPLLTPLFADLAGVLAGPERRAADPRARDEGALIDSKLGSRCGVVEAGPATRPKSITQRAQRSAHVEPFVLCRRIGSG